MPIRTDSTVFSDVRNQWVALLLFIGIDQTSFSFKTIVELSSLSDSLIDNVECSPVASTRNWLIAASESTGNSEQIKRAMRFFANESFDFLSQSLYVSIYHGFANLLENARACLISVITNLYS